MAHGEYYPEGVLVPFALALLPPFLLVSRAEADAGGRVQVDAHRDRCV